MEVFDGRRLIEEIVGLQKDQQATIRQLVEANKQLWSTIIALRERIEALEGKSPASRQ